MAVAFDASSESAEFTTTTPTTFTHTPAGTPRGVIVGIVTNGTADEITGVTYGGVAMVRVASSVGANGRVDDYFVGASIPTGAQTVSITTTGAATEKWAGAISVTAAADTEVGAGQAKSGSFSNVQHITSSKYEQMAVSTLFRDSGTVPTVLTNNTAEQDHVFSTTIESGLLFRQTTPGIGSHTSGVTAASTDVALATVGIQEAVAGIHAAGAAVSFTGGTSTVTNLGLNGPIIGRDLYLALVSKGHTSVTAFPSVTDDGTGDTWTMIGNTTDRRTTLWWKKGEAGDLGADLTITGMVTSAAGSILYVEGGTTGDPTTNLTLEDNASGDETHAGFTPDNADSLVVFGVSNPSNLNAITLMAAATLGDFEPEVSTATSTASTDVRIQVAAVPSPGGPTATGDFTWTQADAVTQSFVFAVAPATAGFTGTGASTLDDVTSDGDGTFTPPAITGTGSSTLDPVTSAGSGTFTPPPITGTGSSTLGDVTSTGTGTYTPPGITGTGASTLEDVDSDGNGVFIAAITGTGASTLDDVTSVGVGSLTVAGQIGTVVCGSVAPVALCGSLGPAASCSSTGPNATCRIE